MDDEPPRSPTEADAARILRDTLGKNARSIQRFPTGLAHFVYDVETDEGDKLVIRLTRPNLKRFFAGALGWYDELQRINVPLPTLYFSTLDESKFGFPVMIMERLPGTDLDAVYPTLTRQQKHRIADQIIAIQAFVATLPLGRGYGYAFTGDDANLRSQWINVLEDNLNIAIPLLGQTGLVEEQVLDRAQRAILSHQDYYATVQPICFLDDITTKNVIIDETGSLSGIVDVDNVAFGDSLMTLAFTRIALLSRGYDTEYTDYWTAQLGLNAGQARALNLYCAMFCLLLMSEMAGTFNNGAKIATDEAKIDHYRTILDTLL